MKKYTITPNTIIKSIDINTIINAICPETHEKIVLPITRVSIEICQGYTEFFIYDNNNNHARSWPEGSTIYCNNTKIDTTTLETMFKSFADIKATM